MMNAKKVIKKINESMKLNEGLSVVGEKIIRARMGQFKTDYKAAAADYKKSLGSFDQSMQYLNDSIWRASNIPDIKSWLENVRKELKR